MTRLREALRGIAEQAPQVDLTELVAAGGRRRRRRAQVVLALAAAAVTMIGVVTGAALIGGPYRGGPYRGGATPGQGAAAVPDLPGGAVGEIQHAYRTRCRGTAFDRDACAIAEWRVVTRTGRTYRVPQALVFTENMRELPVALSRDGRGFAYYDRRAGTYVVRDMVTGATRTASVRVARSAVGVGARLALSDDSRYLVFDPRVGGKDPALLIDMRTGRTVSIPARYNTISVQGGVALLVRYRKTDLWLMPVDGHAPKPVRFKGTFILFSELAPDGRTVSAVELDEYNTKRITLLDAKTGRILRKVTIRGLPKDAYLSYGAVWRSGSELIVHSYYKNSMRAYAVDVGTGKARQIATYEGYLERLISMPGIVAQ